MVVGEPTCHPEQGDFVWIDFDPQAGHEQAKRRPALVLSPGEYHRTVGLAVVCPVTHKVKGYPFEVTIAPDGPVAGVVLADQVKSLDLKARRAEVIGPADPALLREVKAMIVALLDLDMPTE